MSSIRVRVGQQNDIKVVSSSSNTPNQKVVYSPSGEIVVSGVSSLSNQKLVSSVSGSAGGIAVGAENLLGGDALVRNLYVAGVSTFKDNVFFDKDITIAGNLNISNLDDLGLNINNLISENLNVSGPSSLYDLIVSGVSTFIGFSTFSGDVFFGGNISIGGSLSLGSNGLNVEVLELSNLSVRENTDLNLLNVTGVSTFLNNIDVQSFVSAQEYYGPLRFGEPTGGFKPGAIQIQEEDYTKNSINDINFILGKLVPKPPLTINGSSFSIINLSTSSLCANFSPTNNTGINYTFNSGSSYPRNTSNSVTSSWLTEYGPGDDGTVIGFINTVGVGSTTLSTGSNSGTYGSLQIANDKDAFFSTRNPGIASEFYEVYDSRITNALSPDGFNIAYIRHQVGANTYESQKYLYYEDPSTVTAPILTASTPVTPSSPVLNYSSGIPHYTQSSSNAFLYEVTCLNATGDMYSNYTFLTSSGQTTGFQNGGNKNYGDFGGSNPPARNFGVGVGVTATVTQIPRDLHITLTSDAQKFSAYTASTPYGSDSIRATIPQFINIMGTTSRTDVIDEDNILVQTLGSGSGNARRVNAGSTGDNPVPVYTSWVDSNPVATYEATVIGGDLKHDQTNYSTGYLPVGPNYSVGRSGSQYFQLEMIRSNVSEFLIVINGTYSGCWVCMPDNPAWTSSLSGTNGWADMFQTYRGSGIPNSSLPGCSFAGEMNGNSGSFTCVFGTESSSNDANNRILVRFKLNSGNQINTLSFRNT